MSNAPKDRRPIPARNFTLVKRIARALNRAGVTPNQISIFGLFSGVAAGLCLAATPIEGGIGRALLLAAALLIVVRGLSNMFDGIVAVELGKGTPVGALYNEIPDRFSDVAIFVGSGFAIGGTPWLGFCAALVAVLIAFVRVSVRAAGATSDFGGLMAKQQRMFSLAAVAAWLALTPDSWQPVFGADGDRGLISLCLVVIIIGGILTIASRLRRAMKYLNTKSGY